jgi:hypothetical protein
MMLLKQNQYPNLPFVGASVIQKRLLLDCLDNDCALKLRVQSQLWLWEDATDATSFEQQESRPAFLLRDCLPRWWQERQQMQNYSNQDEVRIGEVEVDQNPKKGIH